MTPASGMTILQSNHSGDSKDPPLGLRNAADTGAGTACNQGHLLNWLVNILDSVKSTIKIIKF